MGVRDLVYDVYAQRLMRDLEAAHPPEHVGVILDGNRRWASLQGTPAEQGHRAGAAKITEFLGWCEDAGIHVVTLWLLSTDNLERPPGELNALLDIIEATVTGLAETGRWCVNPVGALGLLPEHTREVLRAASEHTHDCAGLMVNVAVGYGGRREVLDAVRALLVDAAAAGSTLAEVAETLTAEDISEHLYTKGQPDPDLVIRTSGEQRLSGFLLWQSAHSEYYFCEVYWPDFRKVDFLRALRSYSQRHRRYGV